MRPAIYQLQQIRTRLSLADHKEAEAIDEAIMDLAREGQSVAWAGQARPAPTVRVRINVSTSVKGVVTTDTTLEHFGDLRDIDLDAIVEMRLQLTSKVDVLYPPPPLT